MASSNTNSSIKGGWCGNILRVDLTTSTLIKLPLDLETAKKYIIFFLLCSYYETTGLLEEGD